jgi:hypothetical protein
VSDQLLSSLSLKSSLSPVPVFGAEACRECGGGGGGGAKSKEPDLCPEKEGHLLAGAVVTARPRVGIWSQMGTAAAAAVGETFMIAFALSALFRNGFGSALVVCVGEGCPSVLRGLEKDGQR